jgi:hypothetical protein
LSGGGSHPHTLQEVAVNSHATEWYLPVPLSDRDYRVELGYRKAGGGWISLATSAVARVPALHPSEQIYDQFVPFSLDATPLQGVQASQDGSSSDSRSDNSLHERLYQAATLPATRWRHLGRGSEAFHEDALSGSATLGAGGQSSGVGVWASGRNESGAGAMASRQRAFPRHGSRDSRPERGLKERDWSGAVPGDSGLVPVEEETDPRQPPASSSCPASKSSVRAGPRIYQPNNRMGTNSWNRSDATRTGHALSIGGKGTSGHARRRPRS